MRVISYAIFAVALSLSGSLNAQETKGRVEQVSVHMGEMSMDIGVDAPEGTPPVERESLRFEPYQMLDELFRDDVVFLMRHGPTDWSTRDEKDVSPIDCSNQRVMTDEGRQNMRDMGFLMAGNDLRPSRIITSEWCRNQQTLDALFSGMEAWDAEYAASIDVVTDKSLNLLLSLQGAPNVTELREIVDGWTGEGQDGPLLVISHYTNIEELTEFRVYEGEMLMIDPKRESRVLGYLRLRSAAPDVGHFAGEGAE